MSPPAGASRSPSYVAQLLAISRRAALQLVRQPSHSRRAEAARQLARHSLLLAATGAALIILLMIALDGPEIELMPPRGTPTLWPVRILTEFGKDAYVLLSLGGALVLVALAAAALHGNTRALLLGIGTRLQFMFFAVLVSVLIGDLLKWVVGRGRPFVGGKANPFNFVPFNGTEAYYSLPSGHAVTAFALAFAVGALWPRVRTAMYLYAVAIALTRLVLLSHHPSDVVAGALVGIVGAMAVQYWFAARRLGFAIRAGGEIVPLPDPVSRGFKRVARAAPAP
ncbi:MAG: phosphatase PAP2 family protein [Bradyrhizobium sp.]|uniref:phosphatase PAP2 family protein n=1 Tax=Bradyrhizobium sp. TaxID=376 RepID=UPI0025C020E2|nr:phosphatase PAP2 family protein [Bradyrhizobium sp.]MBI5261722.1 phosphatase PAP2 family protein [Bradyrhizobium sp.]